MAEKAAYSLKSNATRLGQRLGENIAERTREIGLIDSFASGSGGSSGKYLENGAVITQAGIEETKKMLSSRRESEKMEGLKRVIAMMTKSLPVTEFFPLVVSLLSPTSSFQSRTLISLYIIHCASTAPELALLSINSYQKDLSDPNPLIRAAAIKTLSSMGLEDIRSLVGVAVEKGSRDGAWYVRRTSADAIISLWRNDSTYDNRSKLLPSLIILLNSASPLTIGSALSAWEEICPTRWDLIHSGYRKWCKMLVDVEEWGQCVVLRVLLRYGRSFFLDPRIGGSSTTEVDSDLSLLLRSSEVLFQHLNPAVVSAVIKLYYYLAPINQIQKIVKPLLRLLSGSPEVQMIALEDCAVIANENSSLLSNHVTEFYVRLSETLICKRLRLRILVALTNEKNVRILLSEYLIYVKDIDDAFSAEAIAAIGTCARRVPEIADECLKTLLQLSHSTNDIIVTQSILVLRSLLQSPRLSSKISRSSIIQTLVSLLNDNKIKHSSARANVYWLIGQFSPGGLLESIGPDSIRLGAISFTTESDDVKLQLLTLSAKLLILSYLTNLNPHLRTLSLLFTYLTALARYDLTYEVRDRARFLKGLLLCAGIGLVKDGQEAKIRLSDEDFAKGIQVEDLTEVGNGEIDKVEERTLTGEQIRAVLFDGKLEFENGSSDSSQSQELGTFELLLSGRNLAFNKPLPSFPRSVPPSSIRDVISIDSLTNKSSTSSNNNNNQSYSSNPMRGFGSDSFKSISGVGNGNGSGSGGRSSPIVLVPTNFANDSNEERVGSYNGIGVQKAGFRDLDDFYADEDEEEDEDEGETSDTDVESEDEDEEDESESESESEEDESESNEEELIIEKSRLEA